MKSIMLVLLLLWSNVVLANDVAPKKVTLGIYMMGITKLDFVKKTYKVSAYVWWLHQISNYKPENSVEIINAEHYDYDKPVTDKVGDYIRVQTHIHGTIDNDWDLSNYPFDRQTIHIKFEDSLFDETGLRFEPDLANSGVHPGLKIDGWQVSNFKMSLNAHRYHTNFGNPATQESSFSQVDVSLDLKREGWSIFISSFIGFFVGFLLTIGGYFISIENLIARNNLLIGSIFSTIGNKYYLENNVANSTTFSLTDAVEDSTFGIIVLFLVINLICHKLHGSGQVQRAHQFNQMGLYASLVGFSFPVGTRLLIAVFS